MRAPLQDPCLVCHLHRQVLPGLPVWVLRRRPLGRGPRLDDEYVPRLGMFGRGAAPLRLAVALQGPSLGGANHAMRLPEHAGVTRLGAPSGAGRPHTLPTVLATQVADPQWTHLVRVV